MPRADLIAMSPDDLAALTNRGTVKCAHREVESGEVTVEWQESDDGTVAAAWSDGVECRLPGGKVAADGRCTCPATELCRHVIRTILAYQKLAAESRPAESPAAWNPGDVTDEELARHFKPALLSKARGQFENGLLIELVRSHKPTARFHDLACTLRFQVAGDIRYVHCDCAADPPCIHAALAVWAFRRLPLDKSAAIVSTQERSLPVPVEQLDVIDDVLREGLELGVSGSGSAWRDRLARLEASCRQAGLIWPAEVIVDMIHQFERYAEHDARFSPDRFAELVGELLIRADAIRADTGAAPQLLIRGTQSDHWTDLASARFIGLGCGVRPGRRMATLIAFLQDANSGSLVAVSREFPDPPAEAKESPRAFWQLAQTPVLKGASFAGIGAGQLLTQGGKRATNHELVLGRAKATVNPQNFSWEKLRPPVFAEDFAEVRDRLGVMPPASLRPRRVAEDFHICSVAAVEHAEFLPDTQTILAILKDSRGDEMLLQHPYSSRGNEGAEELLARLTAMPKSLRFVAGPMRIAGHRLCIEPVSLVFEEESRRLLQPWIDRRREPHGEVDLPNSDNRARDPVEEFARELSSCVSDLMLVGLRRADAAALRSWQELERHAESLGLVRMNSAIRRVAAGLAEKAASLKWDWRPTANALLRLAAIAQLARDVGL